MRQVAVFMNQAAPSWVEFWGHFKGKLELTPLPDILILDEPTRGIDVGAKYEVYSLMYELAKEGKAIIMISSEMPELIGISDRIMVMSNGSLAGVLEKQEFNQEKIMDLATSCF